MSIKKPTIYAKNEELLEEIIKSKDNMNKRHNEQPLPSECLTRRLTEMLVLIVERYANRPNWRGYTYLEDMKAEALMNLIQNALKFNPDVSNNPFGYYTQIIYNSFLTSLEKEKKVRNIQNDLLEINDQAPSFSRQSEEEDEKLDGTRTKPSIKKGRGRKPSARTLEKHKSYEGL